VTKRGFPPPTQIMVVSGVLPSKQIHFTMQHTHNSQLANDSQNENVFKTPHLFIYIMFFKDFLKIK